jgi:hypothetical protein
MPDLTIEFRYTCASNISWATTMIGSTGNEYIVSYHGDAFNPWQCTCPGFTYRKTCKHVKAAEKKRCGWAWEAFCGDHMEPKEGPTGKLCPVCNGEVQIIRVGV